MKTLLREIINNQRVILEKNAALEEKVSDLQHEVKQAQKATSKEKQKLPEVPNIIRVSKYLEMKSAKDFSFSFKSFFLVFK